MMLAVAVAAAIPLFALARRGELAGRPERFVGVIVGCMLVECLLYPAQSDVPVGLFRIPLFGSNLRTHDFLVLIGLLARATARRVPRHVTRTGVLWFIAFVWLATAAARGFLAGHGANVILFSAMPLVGLFGSRILVAGCAPARLIALLRGRWVVPLGVLVVLLVPNAASGTPRTFLGTGLGDIHVDTASVFVAAGTFILLVEWSAEHSRRWVAAASLPLIVTPFTIEQRATLVHLAGSMLVIGWATTRPRWRSVMRLRRATLVWGLVASVAVVSVGLIVHLHRQNGSLPFADYYEGTFTSEGNQLSAQARLEGLDFGLDEWGRAPLFGHGLGHRFEIVRPGVGLREVGTFDNVPIDILVRSGLVGLVLFGAAMIATLGQGIRVWRSDLQATVAALALAAVAVLVGIGTKSLFESILEKGKVALTIGLSAGVISAAVRSESSRSDSARSREAAATSPPAHAGSGRNEAFDSPMQHDAVDRGPLWT